MTRRSVDLPLPLGPSSAVREPRWHFDRSVVERREVTEPLRDRPGDDGHQRVSSLGLNSVMATSVAIAIIASTTEAAYAPV